MAAVALIVVHLACCGLLVHLYRRGTHGDRDLLSLPVLLVPVFGPCCVALAHAGDWWHPLVEGQRLGLERTPPDETYARLAGRETVDADDVVPIEEVMLVNEPTRRRQVMLEVLYAGTDGLAEQLHQAATNTDTEVVHYAVTELVELRKSFDVRLRALERQWQRADGSAEIVEEYLRLDEAYLASGLLAHDERTVRLRHYRDLLDHVDEKGQVPLARLEAQALADIELGDHDRARTAAERLVVDHPDSESGYLCLLRLAIAERDTATLDEVLRALDEHNVYVSPENRRYVDFWRDGV